MAAVTPVSPSMDVMTGKNAAQISGLFAGEDLLIAAPCYIASDGTVMLSDATALNVKAAIAGWTARAAKSGEPVTLFGEGTRFKYAAGLTPGATLYLSTTKGTLEDAATTGDFTGSAVCVSATDIVVVTKYAVDLLWDAVD